MSEKLTNTGLVEHAQRMLALPTSYMWGTLARKIDQSTIDWCRKTYPTMYSADRVEYLQKQIGKRYGCDCVGLIKSYYFGGVGSPKYTASRDYNTNAIFAAAPKKGTLASLPEVPGTCLYMQGHVGIYIGGGKAIECTLGNYGDGVVTTNVRGRGWSNWFYCPFVEYPGDDTPATKPDKGDITTLDKGDRVKVRPGAETYTGGRLAAYVYNTVYDVMEVAGDRVVIGLKGAVTAAVNKADLMKQ